MDKKTGTIITIVGLVVAICLAISCCGGGLGWAFSNPEQMQPLGFILLCPALLILLLPVALWFFLVRGKEDEGEVAQMDV